MNTIQKRTLIVMLGRISCLFLVYFLHGVENILEHFKKDRHLVRSGCIVMELRQNFSWMRII